MNFLEIDLSQHEQRYKNITPTEDERKTITNLYHLYGEAISLNEKFEDEKDERKKNRLGYIVTGRLLEYGEILVNSNSHRFTEVLLWAVIRGKLSLACHKTMADLRVKFAENLVKHYDNEMYSDIWHHFYEQTEESKL